MREASNRAMSEYLRVRNPGEHTLVAAATDSSALGVLDAVRKAGQEANFAIVGQDCIPEVLEEMRTGSSAIVGSSRTSRRLRTAADPACIRSCAVYRASL